MGTPFRATGEEREENPSIVDAIRPGDRVTIVDRFGQKRTGRAVMRSSHGGWVLNMGGAHGTPGIADESNIVGVSPKKSRENPAPRRLGDFRKGVELSIGKLVTLEVELSGLLTQALELGARGERIPDWIADRIRGAQLEKKAALEDVKRSIARHGAAIGEFHVPKARRANPSGAGRAAAVRLYQEFHGVAPKGFTTKNVPDLSQLVHLGRALRVDYEAARPRGPRGTPYRHAFDAGSELFTDRTGRALVILGNIKVSRSPRGRFGYIRAGAGE
jgi:hypothetical protein